MLLNMVLRPKLLIISLQFCPRCLKFDAKILLVLVLRDGLVVVTEEPGSKLSKQ